VGVGLKGRSLDGYKGAVVTPAKAYFAVREKTVFQIQIPHAMQLFKAENGEGPKSHDEFMEKIVKANGIKLPELPPGQIYQYQPDTEELMVIKPAPQ
jgi:RNase P/RNase MRP subunit p29